MFGIRSIARHPVGGDRRGEPAAGLASGHGYDIIHPPAALRLPATPAHSDVCAYRRSSRATFCHCPVPYMRSVSHAHRVANARCRSDPRSCGAVSLEGELLSVGKQRCAYDAIFEGQSTLQVYEAAVRPRLLSALQANELIAVVAARVVKPEPRPRSRASIGCIQDPPDVCRSARASRASHSAQRAPARRTPCWGMVRRRASPCWPATR